MKKLIYIPTHIPAFLLLFLLIHTSLATRPFDWHYNYLSAPFAVFYNPSILGNNAGYTLGLDGHYIDRENYNGRLALVVPVTKTAPLEDHRASGENDGGYFRSANFSHRSSRSAVSVGGFYSSSGDDNDYRIAAGFTAPLEFLQTGASVDFAYKDERPLVSLNAALSANIMGRMVFLSFHNFLTNEWTSENQFGFSAGGAAVLYSDPHLILVPLEAFVTTYIYDSGISTVEGTARVTADLTPMLVGRERTGQTVTVSGGGSIVKVNGVDGYGYKAFASLGAVFMGRSSSAAAFGGYSPEMRGDLYSPSGSYGAAVYNSFRESSAGIFAENEFTAGLKFSEIDDGKIIFHLNCSRANIDSWVLKIEGLGDRNVKTFSGGNAAPSTVLWDKTDSEGNPVKDEPIRAKLVIRGKSGAVAESGWTAVR